MAESSSVGDDHRAVVTAVPTLLSLAPSTSGWNSYPKFSSFTHTPCYCEENVYLLCKKLVMLGVAAPTVRDLFVVFISNDDKKIPLWNQKASKSSDKLVIWDYHVICIQIVNQKNAEEGRSSHLIWDLDSSLPFPLPLDQYVSETFRLHLPLKSTYKRWK
ncbi:protein N-terminal glutamine amidohydrolase isoform X1 [Dendrobium catenatum]|uniref:protein N-terminal glutamine amidohydrolase isoform X1 n=1 Tax=Dendrobium catenatum TaxID=906689 RepID=UPI0009F5EAB5|nr:protein N-terminal glutamine amidohydrolase isoform X1 [Dendrobium catenatum]